jgi:hypothetical protein
MFSKNADKIKSMSREQVDLYADSLCVCITGFIALQKLAAIAIKDEAIKNGNSISLFEIAELLGKNAKLGLFPLED